MMFVCDSLITQISSLSHTHTKSMNLILEKTGDLTSYKQFVICPMWKKMQNVAFFLW